MAKPKTSQEWLQFGRDFNNRAMFPDLDTLAKHWGLKSPNVLVKHWLKAYEAERIKGDIQLPKLINRQKERTYAPVVGARDISHLGGEGIYIVTAAQFGARPNVDVIKALKHRKKEAALRSGKEAHIAVMPIQYGVTHKKDKDTNMYHLIAQLSDVITRDKDLDIVYAEHVDKVKLSDKIWLNTSRIRPTINRPLTGFNQHGGKASQVFAHPKMDAIPVPVDNDGLPKLLMGTGSITYPTYKDDKTSRLAKENHCWGALEIEIEKDGRYHVRQLLCNEQGEFYSIDRKKYTPRGVQRPTKCVDSLVLGDWHNGNTDPIVRHLTFMKGGIVDKLRPSYIFIHDFIDSYSVSHHDEADSNLMVLKAERGELLLREELNKGVEEIRFMLKHSFGATLKFVTSNHDEHVDRWLKENRAIKKNDWHNQSIYHELKMLVLEHKRKHRGSRLHAAALYMLAQLTEKERARVEFIERDQTVEHPVGIGAKEQIKLDMHGDKGISGARGNIYSFANNAMRLVVGHTHGLAIFGPVWRVGTSTLLDLGYNDGPSNWTHTHCVIFENGQRMLINIVNGKWHMDSPHVEYKNGDFKVAA